MHAHGSIEEAVNTWTLQPDSYCNPNLEARGVGQSLQGQYLFELPTAHIKYVSIPPSQLPQPPWWYTFLHIAPSSQEGSAL